MLYSKRRKGRLDENNNTGNAELTIDGLMESLGLPASETTAEEPVAPAPPDTTESEADGQTNPETNPENDDSKDEEKPAPSAKSTPPEELPLERLNKDAHAFANMRKEISDKNKVLSDIGKALGITGKPEEVLAGLQKITNAQQAKEAGVPPEIMERLTALENERAEHAANDRRVQTYAQIQNFQKSMNLDQKELETFLITLSKDGKNPFESQVDLKAEYLVSNFDRLIQQAEQRGIEKQAKLDSKAHGHSTNPGTKTGGGENKTTDINTLDGLDAFLKANIK